MVVSFKKETDSITIRMRGDLVVRNARNTFQKVLTAMEGAGAISLDLAGVGEVDSSGVQLLLHFIFQSELAGRAISMESAPPSLTKLIEAYGVDSIFSEVLKEKKGNGEEAPGGTENGRE